MSIEEINKITQKASKFKNQANNEVNLFELYLEAEKLYNSAFDYCIKSNDISKIDKDILSTIYLYESLDCRYAYELKVKNFSKCQNLSNEQIIIIDKILNKYTLYELKDDKFKDRYNYLKDHRITAELKKYFPIGKEYFNEKKFKKALFYFRRTEEILKSRDTSIMNQDYLLNYNLNYFILKFNISQCQLGILQTDVGEKEFLERQIIKELLASMKYAEEIANISSDNFYKEGISQVKINLKGVLENSLNTWQTLYSYTKSELLLDLMNEIDPSIGQSILKLNSTYTPQKVDYFLFYTHGFNTRGEWKNDLTEVISSHTKNININFILLPWDYGTFQLKFFSSISRRSAVNKFIKRYIDILDLYGDCKVKCLIAHSFGTYITGTALQERKDFICDKIIFAGNILDPNYNWNKLKTNNQIKEVLIEQSSNDLAVFWAKLFRYLFFQKWIGFAGRYGFKNNYPFIKVIKSRSGHSGMLNKKNMADNWLPFLSN